jgi:hypothetical protein
VRAAGRSRAAGRTVDHDRRWVGPRGGGHDDRAGKFGIADPERHRLLAEPARPGELDRRCVDVDPQHPVDALDHRAVVGDHAVARDRVRAHHLITFGDEHHGFAEVRFGDLGQQDAARGCLIPACDTVHCGGDIHHGHQNRSIHHRHAVVELGRIRDPEPTLHGEVDRQALRPAASDGDAS